MKKELFDLAEENGIDREDAEDYMNGYTEEFATPITAAVGKLEMEKKDLKLSGVLLDWTEELEGICAESEEFCREVRKKGKDLAGYIALTAETGYENRCVVDKRIVDKAPKRKGIIGNHEFSIGIPDKKTRRELAARHYLGRESM